MSDLNHFVAHALSAPDLYSNGTIPEVVRAPGIRRACDRDEPTQASRQGVERYGISWVRTIAWSTGDTPTGMSTMLADSDPE